MFQITARIGIGAVTLALVAASTAGPALAGRGHGHGPGGYPGHPGDTTLRTIADLDGPRGIDSLGHGRTLVSEAGGGFSLVVERRHRPATVIPLGQLPTDVAPAIALGRHGTIYLLTGAAGGPPEEAMRSLRGEDAEPVPAAGATLFAWRPGWSVPREVADIAAYQVSDPDPYDTEGVPEDSNPFGLVALRDGTVLVADAAGNDLLRVWPRSGRIETVARLKPRVVAVPEGLPEVPPEMGGPLPPAGTPIPAEAVATSVTVGHDGYWYVGELRGFPATPGTSQVWRIRPGTTNATCDSETPYTGACRRYADGLTSVTDLAAGRHGIYALELSKASWFQWELGMPGSEVGGLFLVPRWGAPRELVPDQLVLPGGVDVSDRVEVVGPLFGPGALMTVERAD